MKILKIWSIIMFMAMALPMMAQDVTESDLEGVWVRYQSSGEFRPYRPNSEYSLQDPESVKFYLDNNTLSDDSLGVAYLLDPNNPTIPTAVTRINTINAVPPVSGLSGSSTTSISTWKLYPL